MSNIDQTNGNQGNMPLAERQSHGSTIPFTGLRIEEARNASTEEIARFVHRLWHETYDCHLPEDLTTPRTPDYFYSQTGGRKQRATLAWLGNRIVGYCDHSSNCIDSTWVDAQFRNRGIGTKLLARQLAQIKASGMTGAQAGCEAFNQTGIQFLKKLGWQLAGEESTKLSAELSIRVLILVTRL